MRERETEGEIGRDWDRGEREKQREGGAHTYTQTQTHTHNRTQRTDNGTNCYRPCPTPLLPAFFRRSATSIYTPLLPATPLLLAFARFSTSVISAKAVAALKIKFKSSAKKGHLCANRDLGQ